MTTIPAAARTIPLPLGHPDSDPPTAPDAIAHDALMHAATAHDALDAGHPIAAPLAAEACAVALDLDHANDAREAQANDAHEEVSQPPAPADTLKAPPPELDDPQLCLLGISPHAAPASAPGDAPRRRRRLPVVLPTVDELAMQEALFEPGTADLAGTLAPDFLRLTRRLCLAQADECEETDCRHHLGAPREFRGQVWRCAVHVANDHPGGLSPADTAHLMGEREGAIQSLEQTTLRRNARAFRKLAGD